MAQFQAVTTEHPNSGQTGLQAASGGAVQTPAGVQGRDPSTGQFTAATGQAQVGTQANTPVPDVVLVDDAGVQRQVNIKELMAKASAADRARAEAAAVAEAAKQQIAQATAYTELGRRLESMDPGRRAQVIAQIMGQQAPPAPAYQDPFTVETPQPARDELAMKVAKIEEAIPLIANFVTRQMQAERQQTLDSRVEALMTEIPAFAQVDPGLRGYAKEAVIRGVVQNPDVLQSDDAMRKIVIEQARKAVDVDKSYRQRHGMAEPPASVLGGNPQPAQRFGKTELLNGTTLAAARQRLAELG